LFLESRSTDHDDTSATTVTVFRENGTRCLTDATIRFHAGGALHAALGAGVDETTFVVPRASRIVTPLRIWLTESACVSVTRRAVLPAYRSSSCIIHGAGRIAEGARELETGWACTDGDANTSVGGIFIATSCVERIDIEIL